ncbi:MAG: hypothetical protein RLZZ236_1983 [Bacteroidota bacterium]|jgi:hypothetical protein
MTPKEKAEDIWMQLFQKQIEVTGSGDGNLCVEMALIAVDEMILVLPFTDTNPTLNEYAINLQKYLEQVKHEIEKL